jgi:NAD/NADP transhydrogenase beta subunit
MFLSLANPSTYVSFGIIALLLTRFIGAPVFDRTEVIIGFLVGAIAWWGSLVALSHHHRNRIGVSQLQKIVGVLIMGLAILLICSPNHSEFIPIITRLIHPY